MHKERLRCRGGMRASAGLGGRRKLDGGDTAMLQIDNGLENHADFPQDELLGISEAWMATDLEKEALRQVSLAAATAYNATVARTFPLLVAAQTGSRSVRIDSGLAAHAKGFAEDDLLGVSKAWMATDLEKEVSLAAATAYNVTVARASPPLAAAQSWNLSSRAAAAPAATLGAFGGLLMWALLIVVTLLALSCCLCFVRGLDRKSTGPPPHAREKKKGGRSRPGPVPGSSASLGGPQWPGPVQGSSASLGVPQSQAKRRVPGSAASLASARSGFSTVSRTTRDSRAGRLLSARLRGRGDGGTLLGRGGAGALAPASKQPVSKNFTFGGEDGESTTTAPCRESCDSSAGDCRFTVPVDTLVEVAETGSFDIKDVGSGLLLKVALRRDGGHKVLEMFQGVGATIPCTTVGPPKPGSPSDPDSLDLCGPHGKTFGNLTLQGNGSFLVSAQGQPLFVVEGNEADLDLRISAHDGRLVGAVSCNDANFSGEEHVEFRVLSGTDPVIVVSCILAVLFLCGDDEEAE